MTAITTQQIEDAQAAWGEGIVRIAAAHSSGGDYVQVAHDHVTTLYAYDFSSVLFKPTLAAEQQFRSTFDDALSYFVASTMLAQKTKVLQSGLQFDLKMLISSLLEQSAWQWVITSFHPEGDDVKVEYSFGYILDEDGAVRINLHHSSMPYAP